MLRTYTLLSENLIERGRRDLYENLIATSISTSYIDSLSGYWEEAPVKYTQDAKEAIAKYVRQFRPYYDAIKIESRKAKYYRVLSAKREKEPLGGFEGIQSWMDLMR